MKLGIHFKPFGQMTLFDALDNDGILADKCVWQTLSAHALHLGTRKPRLETGFHSVSSRERRSNLVVLNRSATRRKSDDVRQWKRR